MPSIQPDRAPGAILAFCALLVAGRCSSDAPSGPAAPAVLRFTAIPDDNATELRARFQPFALYLSTRLGVDAEYVPVVDYPASVEAFQNGDILLAWFGGLTGVRARRAVPGARAIAQGKVDPTFRSYFIAHRDTGIEASDRFPRALEGRRFTFGSDSSTSGRLMPEYFLRRETGKSPAEFFGALPSFSGSHDQTAMLVQSGAFEAGALNFVTYDRLVAEGKIDPQICRVVWTTPPYADYNWTAHPLLDERWGAGFIDRLQKALIELDDPELLQALDRAEGFIRASNEDFRSIEETAQAIGLVR